MWSKIGNKNKAIIKNNFKIPGFRHHMSIKYDLTYMWNLMNTTK